MPSSARISRPSSRGTADTGVTSARGLTPGSSAASLKFTMSIAAPPASETAPALLLKLHLPRPTTTSAPRTSAAALRNGWHARYGSATTTRSGRAYSGACVPKSSETVGSSVIAASPAGDARASISAISTAVPSVAGTRLSVAPTASTFFALAGADTHPPGSSPSASRSLVRPLILSALLPAANSMRKSGWYHANVSTWLELSLYANVPS
mmetsp:Transcript_1662/g.4482  ORF Transcript_1662/g.4482 Transcript_1662/m.4482 type:complete len:210 (+) Transcript_1662:2092-2721(+)